MRRHVKVALVALFFCCVPSARAHEARPGYLELRETAPGTYQVLWKQPARGEMFLHLDPVFPESCSFRSGQGTEMTPGALLTRGTLTCPDGLAGKTLRVDGLEAALADVLLRAGVTGILNFAPVRLRVPAGVYLEDMDMSTIAEITGLTPANVGMKIHRIKNILSTYFLEEKRYV